MRNRLIAAFAVGILTATGAVAFAADTAPQPRAKQRTQMHQRSCYDFAWESQEMKDCLARQEEMQKQRQATPAPERKPMQQQMHKPKAG